MRLLHVSIVMILISALWVAAQDLPYTLQVDSRAVFVDVGVFDSGGRPISGLTTNDFRIYMFEQIARKLSATYSLGYSPHNESPDGKRHKIEVKLRSGNYLVQQYRKEYMAR